MVGVLNFVPYVGPLTSQVVLLLVGVMTYDSLGHALRGARRLLRDRR